MKPLTARQAQVFAFIKACIQADGAPTRQEIADHFGFRSPYAAECHLVALARKDAIRLIDGRARGIALVNDTPASHVVGAGQDNHGRGVSFQEER